MITEHEATFDELSDPEEPICAVCGRHMDFTWQGWVCVTPSLDCE